MSDPWYCVTAEEEEDGDDASALETLKTALWTNRTLTSLDLGSMYHGILAFLWTKIVLPRCWHGVPAATVCQCIYIYIYLCGRGVLFSVIFLSVYDLQTGDPTSKDGPRELVTHLVSDDLDSDDDDDGMHFEGACNPGVSVVRSSDCAVTSVYICARHITVALGLVQTVYRR